jgi:hypothetical protein
LNDDTAVWVHAAAVDADAPTAGERAGERSAPVADWLATLDAWQRRLHAGVAVERSGRAPRAHGNVMAIS